jgi:hypothetical protein
MRRDVDKGLEVMDEFIDRKRWVANYPNGNYNPDVLQYVKEQGACVGLIVEARVAQIGVDSPLTLPRLDCNDFPPKSENYISLGGK